jgi:hypothetical protein
MASVTAPGSRGTVRLASASPAAAPLIDPGFLREPADLDRLAAGLSLARTAAAHPAFTGLGVTETRPGPAVRDSDGLRDWIRQTVGSYYHPSGTCQIGPRPGDGAVVDPELRVHGISGLRVADASVMPVIVNAPLHATVLAVAERAASLITGRQPGPRIPAGHPARPRPARVLPKQKVLIRPAPTQPARFCRPRTIGDYVVLDWFTAYGTVGLAHSLTAANPSARWMADAVYGQFWDHMHEVYTSLVIP